MILYLRQTTDDADERVFVARVPLAPERRAARARVVEGACVEAERDDLELLAAAYAEATVDLFELLRADDDDAIRRKPRERALDREKEASLPAPVVAVEDVSVIGVDEAAAAGATPQRRRREPAIEDPRHTPHCARLRRVRVNDVGA